MDTKTNQSAMIECTICQSTATRLLLALHNSYKIYVCKTCSNAFTDPRPNPPDYSKEDFQAKEGDRARLTKLEELPIEISESYLQQINLIRKHLPRHSHVLEIGGGEGIFLELLGSYGYKVEMIEPSKDAATRAIKRGLRVRNTYHHEVSDEGSYDVICMAHVLEHMDNPVHQVRKLRSWLKPNGYLMLTQTNFKGLMPRYLKSNWYAWLPQEHFTHFSFYGLNFLAEQTEFKIVDYKHSRLVHGNSVLNRSLKYIPWLQDQIHVLLQMR